MRLLSRFLPITAPLIFFTLPNPALTQAASAPATLNQPATTHPHKARRTTHRRYLHQPQSPAASSGALITIPLETSASHTQATSASRAADAQQSTGRR